MPANARLTAATLLLTLFVGSSVALSPWFSSAYTDMHRTFKRFSSCVSYLEPISTSSMNKTTYLVEQVKEFLNLSNFESEQLVDVGRLLNEICRSDGSDYPISKNIDVEVYKKSPKLRCAALDDVFASMYPVLKRAAWNKTEKLDFASIVFHADNDRNKTYGLTDLINTIWIQSNSSVQSVCDITDSLKSFIADRVSAASALIQRRGGAVSAETQQAQVSHRTGLRYYITDFVEMLADRFLFLERSAYWEGATRLQQLVANVESSAIARGLRSIRARVFGATGNQTVPAEAFNASNTGAAASIATAQLPNVKLVANSTV